MLPSPVLSLFDVSSLSKLYILLFSCSNGDFFFFVLFRAFFRCLFLNLVFSKFYGRDSDLIVLLRATCLCLRELGKNSSAFTRKRDRILLVHYPFVSLCLCDFSIRTYNSLIYDSPNVDSVRARRMYGAVNSHKEALH